ncbi:MAG: polymerase, sigma 54 subunit, RpoN [Variovorax sp.]|nr:polymerase, sigma 54 subunit, RpoN [Variovorax sp.]
MNVIKLAPRLSQTQTCSPRLQQAVRLLQMSTMEYAQELENAALSNPFLELVEEARDESGIGAQSAERHAEAEIEWAAAVDRMSDSNRVATEHFVSDDQAEYVQRLPVPPSLRRHLHEQLGLLRLDRKERALADAIVDSLDDDGYLRTSLEELGDAIGATGVDAQSALRAALYRVQSLEPVGVAARDIRECLSLQLSALHDTPLHRLAMRIVTEHIELLASQKQQRLAAVLDCGLTEVQQAIACIHGLAARPCSRFDDDAAAPIVPDAIVRKVNGVWKTALNTDSIPRVRIHQNYAALFDQNRMRGDSELKACLDNARWTVQNANQRVSTILEVARAIVAKQKLFLEHGHLAMKPLGLREIADVVGVHPSTVSRTVHQKYLATPHGVVELHRFFSRGMAHAGGGASAPIALQSLIKELIDSESAVAPWSDAALTKELGQQGFQIARRTVTKYRQELNIPAVERRRGATAARLH